MSPRALVLTAALSLGACASEGEPAPPGISGTDSVEPDETEQGDDIAAGETASPGAAGTPEPSDVDEADPGPDPEDTPPHEAESDAEEPEVATACEPGEPLCAASGQGHTFRASDGSGPTALQPPARDEGTGSSQGWDGRGP